MVQVTASEVMTRNVLGVGPDWPIDDLVEFLSDHAISGAPVLADDGTPIGVVSLTDLARSDLQSQTTVRDIMTPVVFSVEADATVQEVADAMVKGRIHRVLVTKENRMVGIISSLDLLPLVREM